MKLVEIQQRMYGDYKCSCGCGTQLIGLCCGVGDEEDINGYDWRMFDLNCWGNIKMHQHKTLEEIYNEYQPSEDFECLGYDVVEDEQDDDAYEYDDGWDDGSNISCSDCPDDECTGHCFSCAYRSF